MKNHNVESMSLAEYDDGEIALPNEAGLVTFSSNLRQFILLTRRAYNQKSLIAIENNEGLKIKQYKKDKDSIPYFGLSLKFKPEDEDVEDFLAEDGDSFFNSILHYTSTSSKIGVSGERAVFIRQFRSIEDNLMETKILVSTSIFYNDYRVTTGFPSDEFDLEDVTSKIFEQLRNQWGEKLNLEIEAFWNPYIENKAISEEDLED